MLLQHQVCRRCPRPMRFQKGPLADAEFYEYVDSETLEIWCAFITVTSSSEQRWRKGPLVLVSRNFWTRQSHVASVEPSCNPAFWPQLGALFALRCQSCFACELVCCHELQKLSILFSVLPVCFFSMIFWLCGETDQGSSGRGTQNHQIWIILAHLCGCHTRPSQSRAICRTWSCKLDASSDSQARRGNRGGNSGVSDEIWVSGLSF